MPLPSNQFHHRQTSPCLGMDNPGMVFLATDEPHATIEATLKKG